MAIKFVGGVIGMRLFSMIAGVSRGAVGILEKGLGVDGSLDVCSDSAMKR